MLVSYLFFFFFKQKTAYEMRISDWSSDVCSSDLSLLLAAIRDELQEIGEEDLANHVQTRYLATFNPAARALEPRLKVIAADRDFYGEIGRASCRERVCQYV